MADKPLCIRTHTGQSFLWVMFFALLSLTEANGFANEVEPLNMGNRSVFSAIFLTPLHVGDTTEPGRLDWAMYLDGSSHSLIEADAGSRLELDGETWRSALFLRYRVAPRWIVQAELPWISHSGGFLDPLIDRWHNLTGLPDGERDRQPRNQLRFISQARDHSQQLNSSAQKFGDISVSGAYRLRSNQQSSTWLQATLKLPTGDAQMFTGSGAVDLGITVGHRHRTEWFNRSGRLNLLASVVYAGDSKLFNDTQKNLHTSLALHWGFSWRENILPELQLRWHSSRFHSTLDHLKKASLGLDAGVQWHTRFGQLKTGISEDIRVDSAPDLGVYLQLLRSAR